MKRVFIDLYNEQQSIHFSGEAIANNEASVIATNTSNKNFVLDGQGRIEHKNHEKARGIFTGKFVQNVRSGYATKTTLDANGKVLWQYEGVYADDYPHGQGNLTTHEVDKVMQDTSIVLSDQDKSGNEEDAFRDLVQTVDQKVEKSFQGNFVKGVFEGFGRLTVEGQLTFSGQWLGGKPHGHGQCVYEKEKATYTGMWEEGLWSGEGTLVTETGYLIRNQFKEGKLYGEGARNFKSGKTLTGKWINNELVVGKCANADGTIYEGEWLGGRPHGQGVKTIQGGKRYEGMFSLGRPWGTGAKVDKSDNKDEGYWDQAKFLKGKTPDEKTEEFNNQLKHMKTYYDIYSKFHVQELPKTNYDILKEQHADLKMTERELLDELTARYKEKIIMKSPLPREFTIDANLELMDKATFEERNQVEMTDPSKLMSSAGFTTQGNFYTPQIDIEDQPKIEEQSESRVENDTVEEKRVENDTVEEKPAEEEKQDTKDTKEKLQQSENDEKKSEEERESQKEDIKVSQIPRASSQHQLVKTRDSMNTDPVAQNEAGRDDVKEPQTSQRSKKTLNAAPSASSGVKMPLNGLRFEDDTENNASFYTETELNSVIPGPGEKLSNMSLNTDGLGNPDFAPPKEKKSQFLQKESRENDLEEEEESQRTKSIREQSSIEGSDSEPGKDDGEIKVADEEKEIEEVEKAVIQDQSTTYLQQNTDVNRTERVSAVEDNKLEQVDESDPILVIKQNITENKDEKKEVSIEVKDEVEVEEEQNSPIETKRTKRSAGSPHQSIKQLSNTKRTNEEGEALGQFNFQIIGNETNQETLGRIFDFVRRYPNQVETLPDGSVYMGPKVAGQPCGCGFVVIYSDKEHTVIEQVYLGQFTKGQASNFGYLIFDKGLGRYTGEWNEGKYHGKGLFKRQIVDTHRETKEPRTRSIVYDGQWQKGDMSGFGMFQWPSGNIYEGEWLANRRHGLGKITSSSGKVRQAGTWQMGTYINQP